jgi:hypothetical protein
LRPDILRQRRSLLPLKRHLAAIKDVEDLTGFAIEASAILNRLSPNGTLRPFRMPRSSSPVIELEHNTTGPHCRIQDEHSANRDFSEKPNGGNNSEEFAVPGAF